MAQKHLVFYKKKCIGCRLCELNCSLTHESIINPSKSRIRIYRNHETQMDEAVYCHFCANTPCIAVCEFDALTINTEVPSISVNSENCTTCGKCIEACPFNVPFIDNDKNSIVICDLCEGKPSCVENCPEEAIQFK